MRAVKIGFIRFGISAIASVRLRVSGLWSLKGLRVIRLKLGFRAGIYKLYLPTPSCAS